MASFIFFSEALEDEAQAFLCCIEVVAPDTIALSSSL